MFNFVLHFTAVATNCLKDDNFPHPYVAAFFQGFYVWDDQAKRKSTDVYEKFLCAGAILSRKHVLGSYECFETNIQHMKHLTRFVFVSVGSRQWNNGLKYEIKEFSVGPAFKGLSPLFMATLKNELLHAHSIRNITASTTKITNLTFATLGWERNEEFVIENENIDGVAKRQMEILNAEDCNMFIGVDQISCGKDKSIGANCVKTFGSLLVKGDHLYGLRVAHSCDSQKGNPIEKSYFADISKYIKWISEFQPQ